MTKEMMHELILKKIKSGNCILFLGAGVSFNSGIPLVKEIYSAFWDLANLNQKEREVLDDQQYSFEFFISTLSQNYNIEKFFEIFSSKDLSQFHTVVRQMIANHYIDSIITTNFDCLVEEVLKEMPYKKFINDDIEGCDLFSKELKILKVHGCISEPEGIKISLHNVANLKNKLLLQKLFRKLSNLSAKKEIIFWGYSFSDFFDVQPAIDEYSKHNTITVINHTKADANYRRSENEEHFNLDSDDLVNSLAVYFGVVQKFPKDFNWKNHFTEWARTDVENSSMGTIHGVAVLFQNLGLFETTRALLLKALKSAKERRSLQWEIAIKTTLSANHFLQGNCIRSFVLCKWIIKKCENDKHQDIFQLTAAYLNYSNIFTKFGMYRSSLKYLDKAMQLCKEIDFRSRYFACLCNAGLVMDHLKNFDLAIDYVRQSILFAQQSGDYSSLCNRYGYLAEIYNNSGDTVKAMHALEDGFRLSEQLGERSRGKYLYSVYLKINKTIRKTITKN